MTLEEFEKLVAEEFPRAIPEKFRAKVSNVAFLVEDEPSPALRREEGLPRGVTLLGHYRGIPHTRRGDSYGMGGTLPDTITLFRIPILEAAGEEGMNAESVRRVIRDTIWARGRASFRDGRARSPRARGETPLVIYSLL